jgi:hypothetical protein
VTSFGEDEFLCSMIEEKDRFSVFFNAYLMCEAIVSQSYNTHLTKRVSL